MSEEDYLTAAEAAAYLSVGVGRLYAWRKEGRGPISWAQGRKLIYPKSGLDLYRAREEERTMRGDGVTP